MMEEMLITEIELPFWQNPQCYIFSEFQRDDLLVYFSCFIDFNGEVNIATDFFGKISFLQVRAFSAERQIVMYYPDEMQYPSAILEVEHSEYLHNYRKNLREDIANVANKLRHFVVNSHDHQLSVLAVDYTFEQVKVTQRNQDIFQKLL